MGHSVHRCKHVGGEICIELGELHSCKGTLSKKIFRTSGERSATRPGASLKLSSSARTRPGDPAGKQLAVRVRMAPVRVESHNYQIHNGKLAVFISPETGTANNSRVKDSLPVVSARSMYAFDTSLLLTKMALKALPIGVQGTLTQMRLSRYVTCAGEAPSLLHSFHVRRYECKIVYGSVRWPAPEFTWRSISFCAALRPAGSGRACRARLLHL